MIKGKTSSERQLRVAGLIKIALVEAFVRQKTMDPRLTNTNVSVTRVKLSPDLRIATCYVRLLNFDSDSAIASPEELIKALDSSKHHLRKWVTSSVVLKYSPEIRFFYDDEWDKVDAVETFIKNLANNESKRT
jgi:ribosome-binding factor A